MKCAIASIDTRSARTLHSLLEQRSDDHEWDLIHTLGSGELPDVDFIFLFRWPHIIGREQAASTRAKIVVFHTSELPHGRGGSPLQNQILEGRVISRVNAIELAESVDAGRIYASQDITLQGTADDIWEAIAHAASRLAMQVLAGAEPVDQVGEAHRYKRRRDNHLPVLERLDDVHRFIQMLDGEGYPGAHLDCGNLRITFSRSAHRDGRILCDATITIRGVDT